MLSREEARRFYDRFGARQDSQSFYEDVATERLIAHARFGMAESVVEFGCGTGRFARRLLEELLPPSARYLGFDQSATMVGLARGRLSDFGARAEVVQTEGSVRLELEEGSCDRFISNFVLDLLSERDIADLLAEAHRLLVPGGLLGVTGLTNGFTLLSRAVTGIWKGVFALRPSAVGGCRPLDVTPFLAGEAWHLEHSSRVARRGIPSQVVVAARRR